MILSILTTMRKDLQQLTGLRQIIMMQKKVQKIRGLINMGKYDADLAKYIPSLLDLAIERMLDDIDTREKVAHPSYKDMEQLDFPILLTENCCVKPNRRNYNSEDLTYTGLNAAQQLTKKKTCPTDLNIEDRIEIFQEQLKNEHVYRIPL